VNQHVDALVSVDIVKLEQSDSIPRDKGSASARVKALAPIDEFHSQNLDQFDDESMNELNYASPGRELASLR